MTKLPHSSISRWVSSVVVSKGSNRKGSFKESNHLLLAAKFGVFEKLSREIAVRQEFSSMEWWWEDRSQTLMP